MSGEVARIDPEFLRPPPHRSRRERFTHRRREAEGNGEDERGKPTPIRSHEAVEHDDVVQGAEDTTTEVEGAAVDIEHELDQLRKEFAAGQLQQNDSRYARYRQLEDLQGSRPEDVRREYAQLVADIMAGKISRDESDPRYQRLMHLKAELSILDAEGRRGNPTLVDSSNREVASGADPEPAPQPTAGQTRRREEQRGRRQGRRQESSARDAQGTRQSVHAYLQGLSLEDLQSELRRTRAHADLGHADAQAALNDFYTELDRRRRERRPAIKLTKPSRPSRSPVTNQTTKDEVDSALGEAVGPSSLLTDEGDPFMGKTAADAKTEDTTARQAPETAVADAPVDTSGAPEAATPPAPSEEGEGPQAEQPEDQPPAGDLPPTERPKRQWKAGVVEIEEKVEDIARHRAEERLQAELRGERLEGGQRPGWLQRVVEKTWKHWTEEGYRLKYIAEERKRIMAQLEGIDPNMFSPDEKTSQAHREEALEIVQRFLSDYEGVVREREGEQRETLVEGQTKTAIRDVMTRYVNGEIDERTFIEQKGTLLQGLKAEHQALFEKEGATVDNLLDVAREIRATMQHGDRMAAQDLNIDINLGKHKSAIKEQVNLRAFDKLVKVIQKNPVLSKVVNPAVLGFTVSLASKPLISGIRGLAKYSGLGAIGAGTVVGAGFAALRRSTEVKGDITHTRRAMTSGYEIPKGAKRLEKMKEFTYDTVRATNLTDNVRSSVEALESLDLNDPRSMQRVQETLQAIANIEARLDVANATKHDYMVFDDPTTIERQRFEMLRVVAEAKVKVQSIFPQVARAAGDSNTVEGYLKLHGETRQQELLGRVEDVDRRFKNFKNLEVAKAAAYGAVTGFVAGSVAQVGMNWVREHVFGEERVPQSMVEKLWNKVTGHDVRQYVDQGPQHSVQVGDKMRLLLPKDVRAIEDPDKPGLIDLLDGKGKKLFEFKPDLEHGTMAEADKAFLMKQGWYVDERDVTEFMGERKTFAPVEWMEKFAKGTKHIARDAWYDNNTPEVFDKNELRLHWGGDRGTGIDAKGNFVFNVFKMRPDESFHGELSADAQKLIAQGDMRMMLSLSRETQKMVYEVVVDQNGNAAIDPNSEVGKLLFRNVGGKAEFLGRFAEASQLLRDEHGQLIINAKGEQVVRQLATYEGKGLTGITVDQWENKDHITDLLRPKGKEWELPPTIPLSKRKPLEAMTRKAREEDRSPYSSPDVGPYYGYGNRIWSERHLTEARRRKSETLKRNPDAMLDERSEVRRYLDSLDPAYRAELEHFDDEIHSPMKKETRLVIPIPARSEAKTILHTLEQYALQEDARGNPVDPRKFELLIFVNRQEGESDDGTKARVEEFKKQHPELQVHVVEKVLAPERALIGTVRKYANDLALLRSSKRSEQGGKLILVSNDADSERISPRYFDVMLREFDAHPDMDAARGKLDISGEAFEKLTNRFVLGRLDDFVGMIARRKRIGRRPLTSGGNSAFRAEMYASVGGYMPDADRGEDLQMGYMIFDARSGTKRQPVRYLNGAEIITNPRRAVAKAKSGEDYYDEYADFKKNQEVRRVDWRALLEGPREELSLERLEAAATNLREWFQDDAREYGIGDAEKLFAKAMRFLGVKYEVRSDDAGREVVKITDASRLLKGLAEYPQRRKKVEAAKERRRRVRPSVPDSAKEAA